MADYPADWGPDQIAEFEREFAKPKTEANKRSNGVGSNGHADEVALTNSRGGPPAANLDNAVTILESHPQLKNIIWFDEFLNKFLTESPAREWGDADDLTVMLFMQRRCGMGKIGRETVCQALALVAHRDRRNCVKDWLESLVWDNEPRINCVFEDHFGTPATVYTTAVSKNFWLSMVARIYHPGCQVDNMIVLEGDQGTMKSSALRVIGGDWFTEQHESAMNPKAFAENIQGKLLIEISEMDSFVRSEMTRVKQVITNTSDRYREAYAKHPRDHPRQCVFAGTTNRDDWNKDDTGARRFWPIKCNGMVDCAALSLYRDQYFAEAVTRFKAGESWWITPELETKREQETRFHADVWSDVIQTYLTHEKIGDRLVERSTPLSTTTIDEILREAIGLTKEKWSRSEQMRVASVLKKLCYYRKQLNSGKWCYSRRE